MCYYEMMFKLSTWMQVRFNINRTFFLFRHKYIHVSTETHPSKPSAHII